MINEAYELLAINEARVAARAMNTSILSYLTVPDLFCNYVLGIGNNESSPLHGTFQGRRFS